MSQFIHLHLHSEFSIEDGIVRIKPLVKRLKEQGMPACALTDLSNFFGAVKFFKAATSEGIKPLFGAELTVLDEKDKAKSKQIVCLCLDDAGYHNLTCLISKAYQQQGRDGLKVVHKDWLVAHNEGLLVLSGGLRGPLAAPMLNHDKALLNEELNFWTTHFRQRFYLELTRIGFAHEEELIASSLKLAKDHQLPVVATNQVCFIDESDFDAHEARVCIFNSRVLDDDTRAKTHRPSQYLKSGEEMATLFADIPEAITNTYEIAKRCNVTLSLGKNYLPRFPTPEGCSEGDYLKDLAKQGLEQRLLSLFSEKSAAEIESERQVYDERLDIELGVINQMGFPGYFLIVADFIQWAKSNGVPVGPGRGSGAGSLVAYALGITDLDPIEFDLLFERFLNPERVSMPDFDIDFCMEGRDRVIEYVQKKYGIDSVSQIITFGTMAAKAVVRDVGRVLGHPYGFVDKIAKLIPFEIGMTLDKALEQEEELQNRCEEDQDVAELMKLAKKLEGITRNAGKHAGGVVIAPSKLTDFTAIFCEPESTQIVSQFDKDDVEAVGLVKFDFLGLRTLTIINWALIACNEHLETPVDIATIDIDCSKTFDLLKACQTTAVFQLESRGMKELISRLQPDCFEDIIALVALFRPGPLQSGMVDDFIDRKHGRAKVIYPHPKLEPILKPTYGVILYQEQVMQIAQVLAGYSLGAADILRRAMGKKKPEEMAAQRKIFTEGAIANGVEEETATYIFDLMEKFAGYGFNKSHSAAYALIAYQTAWLKAHYPSEFMASVLSSDMDNTDKVVNFINECQDLKIKLLPPDINQSNYPFFASKAGEIRYGLGALKGVGEAAISLIIEERNQNGAYASLFDFCKRLDLRKVNRRVIEALIFAGALDGFEVSRETLFASLEKALKTAEKDQSNRKQGQHNLFFEEDESDEYLIAEKWLAIDLLDKERDVLGFYFSSHPIDLYRAEKRSLRLQPLAHLSASGKTVKVMGLITSARRLLTKSGKKMLIASIDDGSSQMDVTVFEEVLEPHQELLVKNQIIVLEGEASHDKFSGGVKLLAKNIYSVNEARTHFFKSLNIQVDKRCGLSDIEKLREVLLSSQGDMPVTINYLTDNLTLNLHPNKQFAVSPTDKLIFRLKNILTKDAVSLVTK